VSLGPVEVLVLRFPGNQFKGEIIPALRDLVETDTIRIIDALFAIKDENGEATVLEMAELDPEVYGEIDVVVAELNGLLTEEDAQRMTANIPPNSSAAIMLFENVWATRFRDAVLNANGEIVLAERIPKAVIDEMVAEHAKG
jgi:hypothetical protein